ncbi:hypothetical protein ACFQV8_38815 [Pseudonocardia benzenivorans]
MTGRLLRLVLADRRRFVLVGVLPAVVLTVLAAVVSRSDRLAGPDVAPPSVAPQVVAAAPAPLGGPVVVATRFAQYWVDTADPAGWLDRLRPLATDEFGGVVLPAPTRPRSRRPVSRDPLASCRPTPERRSCWSRSTR